MTTTDADTSDRNQQARPGVAPARPDWTDLRQAARNGIAPAVGAEVVDATTPPGGRSPQLAARLRLGDGRRVFAKAARADDSIAMATRREATVTAALSSRVPAPVLQTDAGFGALPADEIGGAFWALAEDLIDPSLRETVMMMREARA